MYLCNSKSLTKVVLRFLVGNSIAVKIASTTVNNQLRAIL